MSQATSPTILLFARGVLAIFDLWPALSIAVKEQWGGQESQAKKIWMASTIIDEFESKAVYLSESSSSGTSTSTSNGPVVDPTTSTDPPLDQDEITDLLIQIMSDEFEANIEDGSIDAVASDIVRLWRDVLNPNPILGRPEDVISALERKAEEVRGKVVASSGGGPVEEDGDDVDDDDEDDEDGDGDEDDDGDGDERDGMDVDGNGEEMPELVVSENKREEPEVDEDGFTMVKGRGKSGR